MSQKRTYGYISPEKKAPPPPRRRVRKDRQHLRTGHSLLRFLLLVPLRILTVLWQILVWLWDHRPRLGPGAKKELGKMLVKYGALTAVFGFVFLLGLFAWAGRDLPDPDRLVDRHVEQSTKIYDRTGEHLLYEIFSEQKRTLVQYEDLPQDLIDGVIATEDTAFYEHKGIRPLSILRSVVYGVIGRSRIGSGASTLTQQLVKNAILTNERKLSRKLKEIVLSIRLEQVYTKEQILKIYFNEIPYGSTNYGVESAAQSYFGKSVRDLTLAESATLAGLPQSPTTFLNNSDALLQRRNFVLRRMFEEGYITEEEKHAAQAEPLEIRQRFQNIDAPHFVLYVKEQLVKEFGEQKVETGGLKVITTLDWDKQQAAEQAVEETGTEVLAKAGANNTALVAMDPQTAQVLALIGSKDFFDDSIDGQFNVATLGKRQPGSSFKPIVYAAAFEKGYTPDTVVFDVITNFAVSGRPYQPLNYDLLEHGPVTLRQALQGSLNIAAVKVLYLVGPQYGVEFAKRLGYTTLNDPERFGLSLVLGGGEVRPIEHAAAYTVFANGGTRYTPTSILKVEEPDGTVLYEWKAERGERVIDKEIADTMSHVLSDDASRAYAFGANGVLTLPGRPVAAKTGTTNGYVDAWTVGYTPSLVASVWAGNTDNTPMTRGFGGSLVAAQIWNAFMRTALEGSPVESFPPLPQNTAEKPVLRGSQGGGITLRIDKVTGKLATSSTPEHFIVDRTYIQPHSILHYVLKDDPRGPVPEDPTVDPQYDVWEAAIQDWIRRKKEADPNWEISFEDPPTEYDDIHDLELIPSLTVVYPAPSTTLYSRNIATDIRVSAPRGVSKVSYQIDGRFITTVRQHPFNLVYYARELDAGGHVLTVVVEDDVGNRIEQAIPFILEAGEEPPTATWTKSEERIEASAQPHSLFLEPFKTDQIAAIVVTASKEGETQEVVRITDFSDLFQGRLAVTIDGLQEGTWTLSARIEPVAGNTRDGGQMQLTIE